MISKYFKTAKQYANNGGKTGKLSIRMETFSKKVIFVLIAFCFSSAFSLVRAQDVITKKDGSDIRAKVVETDNSVVKYKLYDNLSGPTYVVSKSELFMIKYEGGRKELFSSSTSSTESQTVNVQQSATTNVPQNATTNVPQNATTNVSQSATTNTATVSQSPFEQRQPVTTSSHLSQSTSPIPSTIVPETYYQGDWKSQMRLQAPNIYRRYKSGSALSGVGLGLMVGGLTAAVIGVATGEKSTSTTATSIDIQLTGTGAAIAAAGTICFMVGTPLMIVGFSKKGKAKREYFNTYPSSQTQKSPLQSPHLEIRPNGLAFVF
ncbi:MAG: hypothetical protein LBC19_01310 [Tannerella sp.]|jgi:hypothetical protein|nr:hypothetical protein [Tannerella sp.]